MVSRAERCLSSQDSHSEKETDFKAKPHHTLERKHNDDRLCGVKKTQGVLQERKTGEPDLERRQKGASLSKFLSFFCFFFFFLLFSIPHLWHMEVSRLGVESELQRPVYAAATAMPDMSCVCNPHHSSRQHWIPNPPSEARDQTHILMDTSQIRFR